MQLIFGNSEPHFDVASLCRMVSAQPKVQASSSPFEHGFMNPASKLGYQRYVEMLKDIIGSCVNVCFVLIADISLYRH